MFMDLKFAFKYACGWASHPWLLEMCEYEGHPEVPSEVVTACTVRVLVLHSFPMTIPSDKLSIHCKVLESEIYRGLFILRSVKWDKR